MEKIKYYLRAIFSAERYIVWMSRHGWLNRLPDKPFLKLLYRIKFGHKLRLNPPQTYNEKIQWLKLYDRNPLYTLLVDKYAVKEYVSKKIGAEHIIPTLGVWENADDIDFDSLPDKFVLKCNHDSHDYYICRGKANLDVPAVRRKMQKGLERDYYSLYREWAYKDVPRRVIAEAFLECSNGESLRDYKFYCYNGSAEYMRVFCDRFQIPYSFFFDKAGQVLPFGKPPYYLPEMPLPALPAELEEMRNIAEKLSEGLPFARIDLYCTDGNIYFGEITMYPGGGFSPFTDEKWDYFMGEKMQLPNKDPLWRK